VLHSPEHSIDRRRHTRPMLAGFDVPVHVALRASITEFDYVFSIRTWSIAVRLVVCTHE